MPQLYVLDHNFPPLAATMPWPPDLRLLPLARLESCLTEVEDWELLEALDRRGDVTGLITIDGRMLNQPKELVALTRSRLTLVVTDGAGNNALRGTGLLMVHMAAVLQHPSPPPRIFELRPGNLVSASADKRLNALASKRNARPPDLIAEAQREMDRLRAERGP